MLSPRQTYRFEVQKRMYPDLPAGATVLDLGIEDGLTGQQLRAEFGSSICLVGVDAWEPCVKEAPDCYDSLVCGDAIEFLRTLENQSVDLIVAAELIEHYDRDEGLELLNECDRVARWTLITTPNGFMKQGKIKDNPYQVHRSGWTMRDFEYAYMLEVNSEHDLICAMLESV